MEVSDVNTYMKALATFKKGDKTSVTIQRGTETKVFQIEF
jgi:aminopeptidase YwaD